MVIGDVEFVLDSMDFYYVDSGMYEVEKYGMVYFVDVERLVFVDIGIVVDREVVFGMFDEVGVDDFVYILLMYVYFDYVGGVGYFVECYFDVIVMIYEFGVLYFVDFLWFIEGMKVVVEDQWCFYDELFFIEEDCVEGFIDGDEIDFGDWMFMVYYVFGYVLYQVMFYDDGDDVLFVGDVFGIWELWLWMFCQILLFLQFYFQKVFDDVWIIEDIDFEMVCFGYFGLKFYDIDFVEKYKCVFVEWVEVI